MIKIIVTVVGILLILIGSIVVGLCILLARGNKMANQCDYNYIDGCEGMCCRKCELEMSCKMACRNNPENCGGKIS